jgi:NADPH-dependent curcumin reductase CurA
MTESKNRQWILNARPAGKLTGEEFLWNEAPIPRPSDGQVLIRTLWLSADPAQRIWMVRHSYPRFRSGMSCSPLPSGR